MPAEWPVSCIAEEFKVTPRVALRELQRAGDLVNRVMELRAYARAYEQVKNAKDEDSLPAEGADPYVDLVFEVQLRLMRSRNRIDD